jgi:hypothetical protein
VLRRYQCWFAGTTNGRGNVPLTDRRRGNGQEVALPENHDRHPILQGVGTSLHRRGLRFSSQPIVRLRVLKDSTSFSTEADSAPDVIGTKELSSAPQVFNADVRSSVVLSVSFSGCLVPSEFIARVASCQSDRVLVPCHSVAIGRGPRPLIVRASGTSGASSSVRWQCGDSA